MLKLVSVQFKRLYSKLKTVSISRWPLYAVIANWNRKWATPRKNFDLAGM